MNIKGMDENMRCRGFQFEIGKEYKLKNDGRPLELCSGTVFHYCKSLSQVDKFYDCRIKSNRYFEIEVLGEEITDGEKCGSDHIKILREITGDELKALKGLNGSNTGLFNSGYRNSGDMNSGDMNSGDMNSGDRNSGYMNSGDMNSGDGNSGYRNSGDMNSGDRNSGDMNSGDRNSGDRNSGDMNSGYRNSGYMNSGYMNSGDMNSGIANKCNYSNGVFCNEPDMNIRIFNKPSGMSMHEFYISRYWRAIRNAPFELTEWVNYTEEEIVADTEKERKRGYLKTNTYEEAWAKWWKNLDDESRKTIQEIPNFDAAIFKDITGIEV